MDQFRPLGRRDVFGILLPGTILVFIGTYALLGILTSLELPVGDLLEHEFLLTAMLFVTAYLVGSLLRLFAADDVDKRSSEHLLKVWCKKYEGKVERDCLLDFKEKKIELAKGGDETENPMGFNDWLWRADDFPYAAWMNRFWKTHGFDDMRNFYMKKYKASMWSESRTSSKSFFNYCKLVIIGDGGSLAEEVNMAEGLTRFFAGTVAALRLSIWLLATALVIQVILIAALLFGPRVGIIWTLSPNWRFQGFYLVSCLVLLFVLEWMCRLIASRFKHVRQKETETVFHAFYLHAMRQADRLEEGEQLE